MKDKTARVYGTGLTRVGSLARIGARPGTKVSCDKLMMLGGWQNMIEGTGE